MQEGDSQAGLASFPKWAGWTTARDKADPSCLNTQSGKAQPDRCSGGPPEAGLSSGGEGHRQVSSGAVLG